MIKLNPTFESFLAINEFALEETKQDGRILIYGSDDLKILIGEDYNGFTSIDIRNNTNNSAWIEFSLIRSFILKNDDYIEPLLFDTATSFLINNFQQIKTLLKNDSLFSIQEELNAMKDKRVQIRYGKKR